MYIIIKVLTYHKHIVEFSVGGTAQLSDFPGFALMYSVFKQGEFVSD